MAIASGRLSRTLTHAHYDNIFLYISCADHHIFRMIGFYFSCGAYVLAKLYED